jgi:threonine aldolase
MLSYAKHGKFPAPTQAAGPKTQRKKAPRLANGVVYPLFRIFRSDPPGDDNLSLRSAATEFEQIGVAEPPASRQDTIPAGFHMNFASDNTAPVAPAILDALAEANRGYARGYGNDDWTRAVERRFGEIFERQVAAFLVPTGTAANALALAQVAPPWGVVLCHCESHIATDECGAPEFFGHGLKLAGVAGEAGKITPEDVQAALAGYGGHSPHEMIPAVLSITQATEAGTVYRTTEVAALAEIARQRSLALHMDGARFANALVRLNATPAEMTWRCGVDVLSFGATKGGALGAEAVIFFDPAAAAFFGERRKRGGHLLSKHRFIAAQLLAYLAEDHWLALARHANAMADKLADGLAAIGLRPVWPVDANLVFVVLPRALEAKLRAAGASYYVRSSDSVAIGPDQVLIRLVTSFATIEADIAAFVNLCRNA